MTTGSSIRSNCSGSRSVLTWVTGSLSWHSLHCSSRASNTVETDCRVRTNANWGILRNTSPRRGMPSRSPNGSRAKTLSRTFSPIFLLFPNVNGEDFYGNIRNRLLHQAQTKSGWTIRIDSAGVCEPASKVINRDLFADRLKAAFDAYLTELRTSQRDSDIWKKARRRIWWLIRVSV
jgi:hypothetical protein